jgi:hypothetical protein
MAEQKCAGEHSQHLCALAKEKKFAEIAKLAKNPKFICYNCGRVAADKNNLCNAKNLD